MSLFDLFKMGGLFMWPLLVFSMATVAIALERAIFIFRNNLRLDDLKAETIAYVRRGDMDGACLYLEKRSARRMGAKILWTMMSNRTLSERSLIEKVTETQAMSCIDTLETGFNFLTALGSLSPLTGFLGTVSGMIGAFKSIAEATEVNAQIVANGIYEALITTVFGLIIAIIAMVAHSIFSHVVDSFAAKVEFVCSDVLVELAVAGKKDAA
ncbi:MAG: MotA/TolQ/ExbB proton channel family protein [Spirochaetaceae bacterium]|jgi:biopolymer transport protein ExbB|nr:MotA/TolQ/ExbB proton channel family protein [Spirochaetaceae bacterium]